MEFNESIAYVTCICGKKLQVLREVEVEGAPSYLDIDEGATSVLFAEHYATCECNPEYVPVVEEEVVDEPTE